MKEGIEFIAPDIMFERAIKKSKETNVDAVKKILETEYAHWNEVRKYVRENMYKLKGEKLEIEVSCLTDISDPYNCVVVNDHELMTYQQVYDVIKDLEQKKELEAINSDLKNKLCPNQCLNADLHESSDKFNGLQITLLKCGDCGTVWDHDDKYKKFKESYYDLIHSSRLSIVPIK